MLKKTGFPLFGLCLFGFLFFAVHLADAATQPEVFITWRADTYVPGYYEGRLMPTAQSKMFFSVFAVSNNKPIDLSGQTIYWYVNDEFVAGGIGKQRLTITGPRAPAGTYDIRAEIPNLSGALKTIEVPFQHPRVVLETRLPSENFSASKLRVEMRPFFFNVGYLETLVTEWTLNNNPPANDASSPSFDLSIDSQGTSQPFPVTLSAVVSNPVFDIESVRRTLNLTFVP